MRATHPQIQSPKILKCFLHLLQRCSINVKILQTTTSRYCVATTQIMTFILSLYRLRQNSPSQARISVAYAILFEHRTATYINGSGVAEYATKIRPKEQRSTALTREDNFVLNLALPVTEDALILLAHVPTTHAVNKLHFYTSLGYIFKRSVKSH
ncbi:striatin-3 [Platysternon megacephalum]|uniref:Striatin-3 n=1 Tax=Platysternon megacephalum TaxID=55544 RepID=A0A4D9EQS9_9SAUR|nr:striatin-3 [Platysternon megacephalum]